MKSDASYADLDLPPLPVEDRLAELTSALRTNASAVLVAPPGAGKTSRVPVALMLEDWARDKRIIVLEPRRLAARAAAEHLAGLLGEKPGQAVGYRVRMDSRSGPETRIEFVTEGVFTRMILADPELSGIAAVLFDEYHERNLEGDLGLALALDVQASLRADLRILPMSATLDGAGVANLLGKCPVIESHGKAYPVDVRYRSRKPDSRIEDEMAGAIRKALIQEEGSILCFLPGQAEIRRTAERLTDLPANVDFHTLYGAMKPEDQRAAIRPPEQGRRKLVLATAIAQTSLTIDGVRVVIDSGLARVPRHEPSTGLTRLETVRASKATVTQRSGRAGRTAEGVAIRLWHEGQMAALPDQDRPEILEAELSNLVLDLAAWGVTDPAKLQWLDLPPRPAWEMAVESLQSLDALDAEGRITTQGRQLREMPLPPRLAHMVLIAREHGSGEKAARLALLVTERGAGGRDIDMAARLTRLGSARDPLSKRLMKSAASLAGSSVGQAKGKNSEPLGAGALLSLAWPERVAGQSGSGPHGETQYQLANGRRVLLDGLSALAREKYLAICEIQGSAAAGRVLSAAALNLDDIEELYGNNIVESRELFLDEKTGRFQARGTRRLGAILLSGETDRIRPEDDLPARLLDHVRERGLARFLTGDQSSRFLSRVKFLGHHFPDRFKPADETSLRAALDEWLLPMLPDARGPADLSDERMVEALKLYIGFENMTEIDRLAPQRWKLPTGNTHAIDYNGETATLRARVQEFFGMKQHPAIGGGKLPLMVELLSPAMRPVQKTLDIARFWEGSWADVRKDMRGRYPKHVWPEDPAYAEPTSRAKPRSK